MLILLQMSANQPDGTASSFLFFGCMLFTACLLLYVFAPQPVEMTEDKTRLAYLYERKEQVYENLRDLNFEYKAGKLSEGDYTSMRDAMEQEAAGVLVEIEQIEKQQGLSLRKA